MEGLGHMSYEERLGEQGVCSLEERRFGSILAMCVSTYRDQFLVVSSNKRLSAQIIKHEIQPEHRL